MKQKEAPRFLAYGTGWIKLLVTDKRNSLGRTGFRVMIRSSALYIKFEISVRCSYRDNDIYLEAGYDV